MARNKFELEQVLKYRVEMERMRSQEFATAKRDLERAADMLAIQEMQLEFTAKEFVEKHGELENIDDMRMYANFLSRKRDEIVNQKEQIEILGSEMNYRREILLDASKDKKVLESLKEKKANQFRQGMELKERTFMDEISIQKKTGSAR